MPTWDTERYRPVKAELRAVLADCRWHPHRELIKAMLDAGDLAPRTCANLLRELAKDWGVEIRGAYRPGGRSPRDDREYRLVDQRAIEAATTREALAAIDRDIKRARNRLDNQNRILAEASAQAVALAKEIKELEEMREIMKGQA